MSNKMEKSSPFLPDGTPPVRTLQPPAYAPPAPVPVSIVPVLSPLELGRNPIKVNCPACGQVVTTTVNYAEVQSPWISCIPFFMVGFCCCLCLLPFYTNLAKNSEHSCPNCQHFFGTFDPRVANTLNNRRR